LSVQLQRGAKLWMSIAAALLCLFLVPAASRANTYFSGSSLDVPSFASTDASGAADPYPAPLTVSGFHGKVADLDLQLMGFSHALPDDVDVILVAPDGTTAVKVMSDAGGTNDPGGVDLTLDQDVGTVLPDSTDLTTGSFVPADYNGGDGDTFVADAGLPTTGIGTSLDDFDGVDPNGTWKLYVMDDGADVDTLTTGFISDWGLRITGALHATATETESHRIADAIIADPSTLTGASFDPTGQDAASTPNGFGAPLAPNTLFDNGTATLAGFPTNNGNFAILTTGDASLADDTPQTLDDGSGTSNGGGTPAGRGDTAFDVTTLGLNVNVPDGMNCLALDYRFLSEEFPEYVGSAYNDAFIAEVDTSTWTTSGSQVSAPNDFATHTGASGVNVNGVGPVAVSAAEAADTTYDAATGLVTTKTPITPGAHTIFLSIFDQGDHILDSAAFVDNLRFITESADTCKPPFVAETPAPPPESPPANPPANPPAPPSNSFTVGSKIVFKSGQTVLSVTVPGPGILSVTPSAGGARAAQARAEIAKKKKPLVKSVRVNVKAAGVVKVTIKPTAAGKKVLKKKGKLKQKVRITFTPTGGTPKSTTKTITIKRKVGKKK